jgi:hypothetical protein
MPSARLRSLQERRQGFTSPAMRFRLLSTFLAAIMLLFAPLAMAGGGGMAMANTSAVEMTAAGGHCPDTEMPSSDTRSDMKSGCATACAAVPAGQPAMAGRADSPKVKNVMAGQPVPAGIFPEGQTPPPRMTPEI